ncbi:MULTISPECIES: DNA-processing protein DprA [unclassified Actinobaculum]|uniref:DNA-processing protein DprA n=1 Tax=unclassified Actinobaculum TaxID=2609299 RepID=UPI000D528DD6|nr:MULTISPECIES: DNA-processing protein DprA [unclassified Actinobaculum]AWE42670.1 DNA-protecting protein DprA [Actinobaculum sp. 313]RTE49480.1 DNA-protecting protein DprA [Actinobaculum sp. 352]
MERHRDSAEQYESAERSEAGQYEAGQATAVSRERRAAMAWTRIAEGEDAAAVALTSNLGYAAALDWLREVVGKGQPCDARLQQAVGRWSHRLDDAAFDHDADRIAALGAFVMPGDPLWPQQLDDLDAVRPLGLWCQGNVNLLAGTGVAIVGSRDATDYGLSLARNLAFELAERGIGVVSGGAFGIDAAAHGGALAAGGDTIIVMANGVDRPYPAANAGLFRQVLAAGGLFVSESPPGASPLRHRFLARNRIIAALASGCVVVEAPHRSGALSTAHHALEIGRPLGAVPGPVTSVHSAGCHRLLRAGATCVTNVEEILELVGGLFGVQKLARGAKSTASDRRQAANGQRVDDAMAGDPLAVRVRDALPVKRACGVESIATTAGLAIGETLRGLGMLEVAGVAENVDGLWRLARPTR